MKGPFLTIRMRLLGWLQRQCTHPPELVSYDIAEGCYEDRPIGWCRICGAVKLDFDRLPDFGHQPRADYWIDAAKRIAQRTIPE